MPNGILKKLQRNEKGITGLETAIILIAFVVVAAVFAYTALSAGLFSTQKSSEAVYSGLKEAQSTLELRGSVIATANNTGASGDIRQITFTVANVLGGEAIDFTAPSINTANNGKAANDSNNVVVISYIDKDQKVTDLYWTKSAIGKDDDDDLLENNEKFQIVIGSDTKSSAGGNLADALSTSALSVNEQFTIEVKPPVGAILQIERTIPPYIDQVMNLH